MAVSGAVWKPVPLSTPPSGADGGGCKTAQQVATAVGTDGTSAPPQGGQRRHRRRSGGVAASTPPSRGLGLLVLSLLALGSRVTLGGKGRLAVSLPTLDVSTNAAAARARWAYRAEPMVPLPTSSINSLSGGIDVTSRLQLVRHMLVSDRAATGLRMAYRAEPLVPLPTSRSPAVDIATSLAGMVRHVRLVTSTIRSVVWLLGRVGKGFGGLRVFLCITRSSAIGASSCHGGVARLLHFTIFPNGAQ